MKKITIYTNETCSYCKQVKEELIKNDIKFTEKLTNDFRDEFSEISNLIGMGTVPMIHYQDNYFLPARDFSSPQHLIILLNNFKKSNYDLNRMIFERIVTLNYNISVAFNKLDSLLQQIETKIK